MSIVVHLPFICTRKLKLWNALWTFIRVYWRENIFGKETQFTSIESFFVRDSFLRLLDVTFTFNSKRVLFIIINDVFVLLCCAEALIKPGVPLCWVVCQTQITVYTLENLQINWKVWSCKVQKASCKPVRKLGVRNFRHCRRYLWVPITEIMWAALLRGCNSVLLVATSFYSWPCEVWLSSITEQILKVQFILTFLACVFQFNFVALRAVYHG